MSQILIFECCVTFRVARYCCLVVGLFWSLFLLGCRAVEIRRLSVPRWVRNGTEESVVLDCEYVYNENDFRLVVKWFFEKNLEPVYQWIPELDKRHTSGVLRHRLDMDFAVNTADAYSRFRALRIRRPSTDLSGKYTCLVTSLAGQDSREQTMTVFVPAREFELSYQETGYNTVNVSCEVQGSFPSPVIRLFVRPNSNSPPLPANDLKSSTRVRPNGAYDRVVHRTFKINELSRDGATVFECKLELPGTNYVQSKRIAYFPGLEGPRIEASHGLTSSAQGFSAQMYISCCFLWLQFILLLHDLT